MDELDYILSEQIPTNVKIILNPRDTKELMKRWLTYLKSQNAKVKIEVIVGENVDVKYAIVSYSPKFEFTLKG